MSEENTGVETPQANAGGAPFDEVVPKSEFAKVIGQRQDLKAKLRDYEAKLAEREAAEREAQEAALRAQGENEKIIEARDKRIAELEALEAKRVRKERFSLTASAVSAKAGLPVQIIEGLLLREEQVSGADVALDEVTDEAVTDLAKRLREAVPSLFETNGKGGSPNVPGLNMGNKARGEDNPEANKWTLRARKASEHNRKRRE